MLAGRVAFGVAQLVFLGVVSKVGGAAELGKYALAIASVAPVFALTNMQLRRVLATDASGQFGWRSYLGLRMWVTVGSTASVFLFSLAFLGSTGLLWVFCAAAVFKAAESFQELGYGAYQRQQRLDWFGKSLLVRSVAAFGTASVVAGLGYSIEASMFALAVGAVVAVVVFDHARGLALIRRLPMGGGAPALRALLWLAIPLGVASLLDTIALNVPRYLAEGFLGREQLGYLSAMFYFVTAGGLVMFAAGAPLLPRMARDFTAGDRAAFARCVLRLLGVAAIVGVGGVVMAAAVGGNLLELVFTEEFARHRTAFVWLMVGGLFQYAAFALTQAVTAVRRFGALPLIPAASAVTTVCVCIALLPEGGLDAIGIGYAVGNVVGCLLGLTLLWRVTRRPN